MTILNASVLPDKIVIAQDTSFASGSSEYGQCAARLLSGVEPVNWFEGDGQPPPADLITGYTRKIAVYGGGLIIGATGSAAAYAQLLAQLDRASITDFAGFDDCAPAALREIGQPVLVIAAGSVGDVLRCHLYSPSENFQPLPLTNGHTFSPPYNPNDKDYEAFVRAWHDLENNPIDDNLDRFHVALAENQHRSYLAGLLPHGVAIGGTLQKAVMTVGYVMMPDDLCQLGEL